LSRHVAYLAAEAAAEAISAANNRVELGADHRAPGERAPAGWRAARDGAEGIRELQIDQEH